MKKILVIILFLANLLTAYAQVEHVPVSHPVYYYLEHAETKGILEHFSLSELPLQRKQIVEALKTIRKAKDELSSADLSSLDLYEREFGIKREESAVVFDSESDSGDLLWSGLLSDSEKYVYRHEDSLHTVRVEPLGSLDVLARSRNDKMENVLMGNLGGRLSGTLSNRLGYYLQVTNGVILSGERSLAMEEIHRLQQNVKFVDLASDFDFSESHVRFDWDWFYMIVGRETRLIGAGIDQRLFSSGNAPPSDAVTMGARFKCFEYRVSHSSLLAQNTEGVSVGFNAGIPAKYMATHRLAIKPSWGEFALWEGLIYSKAKYRYSLYKSFEFL